VKNALAKYIVNICMAGSIVFKISTVFLVIEMPRLLWIVPPMYLCAVGCSILIFLLQIIMQLEIPLVAAVHENTKQALRIRRLQTSVIPAKRLTHFRKLLKGMRPCSFYAGLCDTIVFFSMRICYYALPRSNNTLCC